MNIIEILERNGFPSVVKNGEGSGPCPYCGGSARLAVWVDQGRGGRFYCRKCLLTGDAVTLLTEIENISVSEAINVVTTFDVNPEVRPEVVVEVDREKWAEQARSYIEMTQEILRLRPDVTDWLTSKRCFTESTIVKAGFGWNPDDQYLSRKTWGLPDHEDQDKPRKLLIPEGLIIPITNNSQIHGLKVRRPTSEPRYHLVAGSTREPLIAGRNCKVLFIVESELDAVLIEQEAGDLCIAVGMGSCTCRPGKELASMISQAKLVFVALDGDEYGAANWKWWQKQYSNARRWPIPSEYGKDPGEAISKGLPIREWVKAALPPLLLPDSLKRTAAPSVEFTAHASSNPVIAPTILTEASQEACAQLTDEPGCVEYTLVKTEAGLADAIKALGQAGQLYLDTETYSDAVSNDKKDIPAVDPFRNKVRLISLSDGEHIFLFDMKPLGEPELLFKMIQGRTIVGHNLAFDLKSLMTDFGEQVMPEKCFDTMHAAELLHYAADPWHPQKGAMTLAGICDRYLDITVDKSLQVSDWSGDLTAEQLEYAAKDVTYLPQLVTELTEALINAGFSDEVIDTEMAFVLERARIELAGIPIDVEGIEAKLQEIEPQVQVLDDVYKKIGVNPRSPKMLDYLQELGYDIESTSKNDLVEFAGAAEIDRLINLRELKNQVDYLSSSLERQRDGKVYPDYRQIGAPTGRMSCHGLNLQATPTALASLFACPATGYVFITADLPAIEMRIAAIIAEEDVLINCFESGEDPHSLMASRITGKPINEIGKSSPERKKAKAANFGFLYGMGATTFKKYARAQGIEFSQEEAEAFRQEFFKMYPGIKSWHRCVGNLLRESEDEIYMKEIDGMVSVVCRETLSGRAMKAAGYCSALNYAVQGTGADMIKLAAVLVGREFRQQRLKARIVHIVHDDLRVLCPIEEVAAVSAILTGVMGKVVDDLLKEFKTVPEIKVVNNLPG